MFAATACAPLGKLVHAYLHDTVLCATGVSQDVQLAGMMLHKVLKSRRPRPHTQGPALPRGCCVQQMHLRPAGLSCHH